MALGSRVGSIRVRVGTELGLELRLWLRTGLGFVMALGSRLGELGLGLWLWLVRDRVRVSDGVRVKVTYTAANNANIIPDR